MTKKRAREVEVGRRIEEEVLDQDLGRDEDRDLEIENVDEVGIDVRARDREDADIALGLEIEDVQDHLGEGRHRRREQRMRSGRKWRN